jgi:hypothetical protein
MSYIYKHMLYLRRKLGAFALCVAGNNRILEILILRVKKKDIFLLRAVRSALLKDYRNAIDGGALTGLHA